MVEENAYDNMYHLNFEAYKDIETREQEAKQFEAISLSNSA